MRHSTHAVQNMNCNWLKTSWYLLVHINIDLVFSKLNRDLYFLEYLGMNHLQKFVKLKKHYISHIHVCRSYSRIALSIAGSIKTPILLIINLRNEVSSTENLYFSSFKYHLAFDNFSNTYHICLI
jgi:hypothetical protein